MKLTTVKNDLYLEEMENVDLLLNDDTTAGIIVGIGTGLIIVTICC